MNSFKRQYFECGLVLLRGLMLRCSLMVVRGLLLRRGPVLLRGLLPPPGLVNNYSGGGTPHALSQL